MAVIVSKWDKDTMADYPDTEKADITMMLVDALEPSAKQRQSAHRDSEA